MLLSGFCCLVLAGAAGCSDRKPPPAEESEEWNAIQPMADDAVVVPVVGNAPTNRVPASGSPTPGTANADGDDSESAVFLRRLEQAKAAARGDGETLLTGKRLVFDYDRREVQLERDVVVEEDEGTLRTEQLVGRFTASNRVEYVEAKGDVQLESGDRTAAAEQAVYDYASGVVQLTGRAHASAEGNRISGERIEFRIRGDRRVVCEPNALLEITGPAGLQLKGMPQGGSVHTEIRADRVEYDESGRVAVLTGNVRLRDPRAAMDCETVRIFLKEGNEIDWIEASGGVIIQSDDRKALAERATYQAEQGLFTLDGDPKVKQGPNVMTGDRIKFWHETRRMVCEPNARVLLYLDPETKAKFLKDLNE